MFDLRTEILAVDPNTKKRRAGSSTDGEIFYAENGKQLYVVSTQKDILIKRKDLEAAYKSDPIIFNSVNLYTQVALHAGYKLAEIDKVKFQKSKALLFLDAFFDHIGENGRKTDKEEFFDRMFTYLCIFGNFYAEKVFNTNDEIIDLNVLDPKKMDYARDSSGNIVLDLSNNPVGYVEVIDFGTTDREVVNTIQPPKNVTLPNNAIYMPADKICHLTLYNYGDGLEGLGIIEPGYLSSKYKLNLEKAFTNLTLKYVNPKTRIKVGDATHEPTPTQIANALKGVSKINQNTEFAVPYWVDVEMIQAKQPDQFLPILNYFIQQETASTGIPGAFSTGGGEATNRSTLNRQEYMMKLRLKDIIRRVSVAFEKQILNPILESNGYSKYLNKIKLVWGEIATEDLDSKAKRLVQYFSMGLITKTPILEEYIREIEELPQEDLGDKIV